VMMFGRTRAELTQNYPFLVAYAVAGGLVAAITWKNWWLDARLATFTHGIDMAVFTAIAFSATGWSSPFTLFFILPLLSAAVRWSWRETALTATVLIILFMVGGLLLSGSEGFEPQRFVLRGANLFILTLLLIWFGVHQRFARAFFRIEEWESVIREGENPLARSLSFAMRASRAASGALIVGPVGEEACDGFLMAGDSGRNFTAARALVAGALLERYALLEAIEAGAAVRTRLSLARDVHDSIVQFLAGAAFRIEAIKRSAQSGAAVEADLDELKRLFVEEQGEIRGFV